jgi:hypothetical protein
MVARPSLVAVFLGALLSLGASYRTPNFVVEAATPQVAQQVGQYAEYYRKQKALDWLGQEMPPWPQPCPLRASVSMNGSGGATSFAFDNGRILSMEMNIEGTLERLLNSVLPHEVTHTVFAHYFRCPLPRWADEGGSVLSEDDIERNRHDQLVRQILNSPGRSIPLRRLFALTRYPPDVMVLYAEGYSVANFLVGASNRSTFLAFVNQGMRGDWDGAVRTYYRYNNVDDLERAWLQHLRDTKGQPPTQLASRAPAAPAVPAAAESNQQLMVRTTVPPAQPLQESYRSAVRAQAPEDDAPNPYPVTAAALAGQGWDSQPRAAQPAWQTPPRGRAAPQSPVHLNSPQAYEAPPVQLGQPIVGQPR